jgi:hypothetical protein
MGANDSSYDGNYIEFEIPKTKKDLQRLLQGTQAFNGGGGGGGCRCCSNAFVAPRPPCIHNLSATGGNSGSGGGFCSSAPFMAAPRPNTFQLNVPRQQAPCQMSSNFNEMPFSCMPQDLLPRFLSNLQAQFSADQQQQQQPMAQHHHHHHQGAIMQPNLIAIPPKGNTCPTCNTKFVPSTFRSASSEKMPRCARLLTPFILPRF